MPDEALIQAGILLGVCAVAALYASVGHGGASGYLAILTLIAVHPRAAATSALLLNMLVAGISWAAFSKAGHFSWRLAWPFLAGSVPAAAVGGWLKTSDPVIYVTLSAVLAAAAVFMVWRPGGTAEPPEDRPPGLPAAAGVGAGLGLVAGMVGIGGGIFLSPLMVVMRWSPVARVAATSACFIVVNSAAGLAGRLAAGTVDPPELSRVAPLAAAAFAGGLLGGWLGARKFRPLWLRICLALVLCLASGKMILKVLAA